jgi:hypothetical protein
MLLEMLYRHFTMSCALVSLALDADDEETGRRRTIAAARLKKILRFISLFQEVLNSCTISDKYFSEFNTLR